MCNSTDCQEDRREAYKASMMRDEAPLYCTMCNDAYAQSIHDLCNECQDYCDGRLLGFQTPHDEEDDV